MIDHVVLAVPDLADGVAWFQRLTGVRPVMGGSHINLGTANYLVGLVLQQRAVIGVAA
jgi:catechol 2,3-dioxygenase-like lactoylglutathione lyase family enzyme